MELFLETCDYSLYIARKGEWTNSHSALLEAVGMYLVSSEQPDTEDLTVQKTPSGKPYFTGRGLPCFSISHSGGIWMAAFSPQEIGLDIQEERPFRREAISKRFFHPDEDAYLAACGYSRFFTIWAAKEAYAKYRGTGIDASFRESCCIRCGSLGASDAVIDEIPGLDGFSICVCRAKNVQ